MSKAIEIAAGALLVVCVAVLFAIQAVRFCIVYGITALVVVCCVGGVLLWAAGG